MNQTEYKAYLKEKKPLIIIAGPTAVGKTKASIGLAKKVGGEIISADSMQVYKGMDIGSAKVTKEEMDGVTHHLVDILSPFDEFHVAKFQELAKAAMEEIYEHGHIPILVGGTGFYIQALLYDVDFTEEVDHSYRDELAALAADKGPEFLHDMLQKVDTKSADIIHANNVKRVIRALEYYHLHQRPLSEHNAEEWEKKSPYTFWYFVFTMDRAKLYDRIEQRVDIMLQDGLEEEVKALKELGVKRDMVSMQGIGYKEMLSYLDGELSYDQMVADIKENTRHFAKRQLTWFRREKEVIWVDKDNYASEEAVIVDLIAQIKKKTPGLLP